MKKLTNLIYYPAGCYGTFFEYIYYYCTGQTTCDPFTATGSSHEYQGNFFHPHQRLTDYINSSETYPLGRVHPSLFEEVNSIKKIQSSNYFDIVVQDLEYLEKHFNKIIVLHPTSKTKLWVENNVLDKCVLTIDDFNLYFKEYGLTESYFGEKFITNTNDRLRYILNLELDKNNAHQWGKTSIFELDLWELRELMSIYWDHRYKDYLTCWDKLSQIFKKIKFISLEDIKDNPIDVMSQYLHFVGIKLINKDILENIINKWESLQKHKNKDADVSNVVNSILNNEFVDWEDKKFNLLDESYIQRELRQHNIEIKCFDLNVFPSNSRNIAPLLEKS